MSLTKEERLKDIKARLTKGEGVYDFPMGTVSFLISEIDRLFARCEGLERAVEYGDGDIALNHKLLGRLSSLREAAELILSDARLGEHDNMLEKMGRPSDITVDSLYYAYVRFHLIRNLNEVVQKIKGGK